MKTMTTTTWSTLALAAAVAGCGGESNDTKAATTRRNLGIELAVAHTHVMKTATLSFVVRDLATCTNPTDTTTCDGVPGLQATALHRFSKDKTTTEYPMGAGVLEDKGGGTYAWTHMFGMMGTNMVGLRFTLDGNLYESVFPFETSRAGGEGYRCDLDNDGTVDHVFQVRWDPSAWPIMGDGTQVAYNIELQRSFNTPVNTDQPYTNLFDHLMPSDLDGEAPTVTLMMGSGDGAMDMGKLTPTYVGKGIYQIKHAISPSDTHGMTDGTFWFKVEVMDTLGCMVTTGATEEDRAQYYFPVMLH